MMWHYFIGWTEHAWQVYVNVEGVANIDEIKFFKDKF